MHTVYSKPDCPFCDQAKALLKQKGLPYSEVILDVGQPKLDGISYISRDDLLARFPTARTMPQISWNTDNTSVAIGGYTELRERLR
jgi:glutaredoxin